MCYNIFVKKLHSFLKHLFVPHDGNDYKPHFFREYSIGVICILVLVVFSFSIGSRFYIKNTNMTATVLPAVLVDLTNKDRNTNGLNGLVRSNTLDEAARLKAEDMAQNQYFAHNSPNGLTPWHFMDRAGYSFVYAGENLAVDFSESIDVEQAWLNSPKHRANIMDPRFTEIGVATVDTVFEGQNTTFVVQMFGKPINIIIPESEVLTKSETKEEIINTSLPKTIALAPEVKGESISVPVSTKVETISETKEFAMVKNTEIIEEPVVVPSLPNTTKVESSSSFFERLIFRSPYITDIVYKILVFIVLIALSMMVFIEIKTQHPKNIAYGVLLILLIIGFTYLNKIAFTGFFVS